MVKIVAINGSRRAGSYTKLALEHALGAAEEANAETELIDLGTADLPLYHPDIDEQGDSADLLRTVREADGVLIGSPVYHGSYSSTFKNFHDYCGFDEYESTVVGLLVVAGGGPYASTLDHLRSTVRGVHGWVVPHQVGIRTARQQFVDGEFTNSDLAARTAKLGHVVTETVVRRKASTQVPSHE
jgi:azobenzene reductase